MIYISGRITGKKNWQDDFNIAKIVLKNKGYKEIVNPVDIDEVVKRSVENPTYSDYMKEDIYRLTLCDSIFMLKGWWRSKGARLERHIAKVLGMKIIYQKRGDK